MVTHSRARSSAANSGNDSGPFFQDNETEIQSAAVEHGHDHAHQPPFRGRGDKRVGGADRSARRGRSRAPCSSRFPASSGSVGAGGQAGRMAGRAPAGQQHARRPRWGQSRICLRLYRPTARRGTARHSCDLRAGNGGQRRQSKRERLQRTAARFGHRIRPRPSRRCAIGRPTELRGKHDQPGADRRAARSVGPAWLRFQWAIT